MINRRFSLYKGEMPFEQELDLRHPWVQAGMLAFWPMNEGGGDGAYDLVGHTKLTANSFGATNPWSTTGSASGIKLNGTNFNFFTVTPPRLYLQPPLTIMAGFQPLGNPGGNIYLGSLANTNMALQLNSSRILRASFAENSMLGIATVTTGADHVGALTVDLAHKVCLYLDGQLDKTTTFGAATAGAYSGTSNIYCGYPGGFNPNYLLSWVAIWNQALPAGINAEIGASPNAIRQVYQHRRRRTVFAGGSTIGGSATLSAATGVFSFSGNAANLLAGRVLGAAAGAYGLTGQAAALLSGRVLPAATGAFALTGNDAGLLAGRVLPASTGVYALTGNDAGLLAGRVIAASTGVYVLAGNAANLVYTQPGAYTLVADTGVFSLAGNAAGLLASRVLPAGTGAFTFTGNAANLVYTPLGAGAYVLVAETGTFALTGSDAALLAGRVLAAAPGSFALSSVGASLVWSGHITPSFVDPDEVTMITP